MKKYTLTEEQREFIQLVHERIVGIKGGIEALSQMLKTEEKRMWERINHFTNIEIEDDASYDHKTGILTVFDSMSEMLKYKFENKDEVIND